MTVAPFPSHAQPAFSRPILALSNIMQVIKELRRESAAHKVSCTSVALKLHRKFVVMMYMGPLLLCFTI